MNYRIGDLMKQIKNVLQAVKKNFHHWSYESYRAILRSFGMDCKMEYAIDSFSVKSYLVYFAIDNKANCVGRHLHESTFGPDFSFKGVEYRNKQSKKYIKQTLHLKNLSKDLKKKMKGVTTVLECIILCKELGIKLLRDSQIKLGNFYVSDRQLKVVIPLHTLYKPRELETYKITKDMYLELNTDRFTKQAQETTVVDSFVTPIVKCHTQQLDIESEFDFLLQRNKEHLISEQRFLKTIKLLGPSISSEGLAGQSLTL
ncbi:hypothetical protein ACYSNM_10295 [Myroides sp. LJL116]